MTTNILVLINYWVYMDLLTF